MRRFAWIDWQARLAAALICAAFINACGGDSSGDGNPSPPEPEPPVAPPPPATPPPPVTNRLYVANHTASNLAVIDTTSNSVITRIPLQHGAGDVAVNPATNRVYVGASTLAVIDAATNTIVADISLPPSVSARGGIAVDATTNKAYVAGSDCRVYVLDLTTNTVSTNIPLCTISVFGGGLQKVVADSVARRVYVVEFFPIKLNFTWTLHVIDSTTNSVLGSVAGACSPGGFAVNPATSRAYVQRGNCISTTFPPAIVVVDLVTRTQVGAIPASKVGTGGAAIDVSADRAYFVSTGFSNTASALHVVDVLSNTMVDDFGIGQGASDIAVDPNARRAYVASFSSELISVIDTASNTVIGTIALPGEGPFNVAVLGAPAPP
jgi:YVTN family beta-propeller protein